MEDVVGTQLVEWGTVLLLETRGRRSGAPVRTPVGYVEDPDGTLLVAAGDPAADWVRNLREEPSCRVTIAGRTVAYSAEELEGERRSGAIRDLILRYGTPAERLGSGPAFGLRPVG